MSKQQRMLIIAKKELVEFARDWRTIVALLIIPLLMFPVLFVIFPLLLQSEAAELDALELKVICQCQGLPESMNDTISNLSLELTFEPLSAKDLLSDASGEQERLRNGSVDAILRIRQNGEYFQYAVLHLSTSDRSNEAWNRLIPALDEWENEYTIHLVEQAGLDVNSTLNPLQWNGTVEQSDVATAGEQSGMMLSLFIPLVLAVWTFTSAIQPSIDMTAGERERGSLEALLGLPCSRLELLYGKWLAVGVITSIGVLLQVIGLLFAISYLSTTNLFTLPELSLTSMVFTLLAILAFAMMIVAVELALAMRSHSVKEAGSILGPAVLVILFPALFTQVINLDGIELIWFSVPIVNILLALRELLMDRVIASHILVWLSTSVVYASLAAWYAARQFKREDLVTTLS